MSNSFTVDFDGIEVSHEPFHHFSKINIFDKEIADQLLEWLTGDLKWDFTETDFYTQYEFSLKDLVIPDHLNSIISDDTIAHLKHNFSKIFNASNLQLVDITVHKLLDGHKMGVHNDFIGGDESHRLIVQLNEGWTEANGGYLMLFNSKNPQDLSKLVQPKHNTAIGFAISANSYHAVSRVNDFERYTLVYTFKDLDYE